MSGHLTSKEQLLQERVRDSGGLIERLEESRRRIAKMCSERRGPRMTIPVEWSDDDFFICLTLEDAIARLAEPPNDRLRELEEHIERMACWREASDVLHGVRELRDQILERRQSSTKDERYPCKNCGTEIGIEADYCSVDCHDQKERPAVETSASKCDKCSDTR